MRVQDMDDLFRALEDLSNNYSCSCVGTKHCPCPRCKVSIDQSRELLDRVKETKSNAFISWTKGK